MAPKATAATGGHRYAYRFGQREQHHLLLLGIKNKQTRKQQKNPQVMVDPVPWYKAIAGYQVEISYKMKNSL